MKKKTLVLIALKVEPELLQLLDDAARRADRTRSAQVRAFIRAGLQAKK